MKVFVTGGTGFVGKWLVEQLAFKGHEVLVLSRSKKNSFPQLTQVSWAEGDFGDSKLIEKLLKDFSPDSLIHLAWEGLPDYSEGKCLANFHATLDLFKLASRYVKKSIISTGSCWEYQERFGEQKESSPLGTTGGSFLGVKNALRFLGDSLCKEQGVSFYWARLFFVYGPGQRKEALIPSLLDAAKSGLKPNIKNPLNANDFIYVEDVADAITRIMEKSPKGVDYNIASGKSTEVKEVIQKVYNILGVKFDETNFIGSDLIASQNFWGNIKKMEEELDWRPRFSLESGIQKTIAYFNRNQ